MNMRLRLVKMATRSVGVICLCVVLQMFVSVVGVSPSRTRDRGIDSRGYTEAALERLSEVFGIDHVPSLSLHSSPPEYMLELYHSVAFSDGVSKRANPYDADVVRGFPDRATRHQTHYYFNVSFVDKTEGVLAAELHLYKMRPDHLKFDGMRRRALSNRHVVMLRLYQVLSEDWERMPDRLRLLTQRRISAHVTGWQVFTVTDTIRSWVNATQDNHGFLITATTLDGNSVNGTQVRFAQRREHHDSKQPVLVVFSGDMVANYVLSKGNGNGSSTLTNSAPGYGPAADEGNPAEDLASVRQSYIQFLNEQYRAENGIDGEFPYERYRAYMSNTEHDRLLRESRRARLVHERRARSRKRPKRNARKPRTSRTSRGSDYYKPMRRARHKACQRNELYVDFGEIGWSGWIISPKGYNAYHCWGECPFPLGQYHRPTNHATVQSIVYTMRINKNAQLPCCVPDKLYSISLLYFDDEENVILKQYDEMVAASCGCH